MRQENRFFFFCFVLGATDEKLHFLKVIQRVEETSVWLAPPPSVRESGMNQLWPVCSNSFWLDNYNNVLTVCRSISKAINNPLQDREKEEEGERGDGGQVENVSQQKRKKKKFWQIKRRRVCGSSVFTGHLHTSAPLRGKRWNTLMTMKQTGP